MPSVPIYVRQRLLWQLYPSYLIVSILTLVIGGWLVGSWLNRFYYEENSNRLTGQARFLKQQIEYQYPDFVHTIAQSPIKIQQLREFIDRFGASAEIRITLMISDGKVLADNQKDPQTMENHADRPEMKNALSEQSGSTIRYSNTAKEAMQYVALPIVYQGETVGVIRTSASTAKIDHGFFQILKSFAITAVIVLLIISLVGYLVAQKIARPLQAMRLRAEQFAAGDYSSRMQVPASAELASLAESINATVDLLEERIYESNRQYEQQEAVLSSMVEGVLAVDSSLNIISMNEEAARLLNCDDHHLSVGKNIHQVVKHDPLCQIVNRAILGADPIQQDFEEADRVLSIRAATLGRQIQGRQKQGRGVVVVLNDVTNVRKLDNLRREFVANVSHELKTPVTSIKGFVETLLDGALHQPQDAQRFLGIINKQADRLTAIIDDLLSLAIIEQKEGTTQLQTQNVKMLDLLSSAVSACHVLAKDKETKIEINCDELLTADVNSLLLEQAVTNLLVNAINYSPSGSRVELSAMLKDGLIHLAVRDFGVGISAEHLPRLFERFYRVDKARSRDEGGTGLGLAIVKHIVQAHHGEVLVKSTPNVGSTFTIVIPKNATETVA